MKQLNSILIALIIVLLGTTLYFGNLLLNESSIEDTIEYATKESDNTLATGEKLAYAILKRSKGAFGGNYYYFGVKKSKDTFPFLQKYTPVLDSDKDKFDKIEGLEECEGDSYILTLRVGDTIKYLQFNPYDKNTNEVDEKVLKTCKRGRP
ncbi:hypothetical protein [Leptospira saintgironsiae]|uniref:Uncharacterized protein n=1 Tax=Leptospira saintgironsiae TaxID=2023183 RepID=A0A2M9Y7J0_9LEPT|nr:hypothetical protein [Leptospira saintgironsiae]PJZ47479.1 hypothetical protein CH362_18970 [Leptospira saintgironsiae]